MAVHSSILAWEIPWMEEPGRLQSVGLQSVRHDSVTKHTHMWDLESNPAALLWEHGVLATGAPGKFLFPEAS